MVHTLHLPPDAAVADALREAARCDRAPTVAGVSASQAGAWRRVVAVDAILPPYVPTRVIRWSPSAGEGAVFAGRLSPEKGAIELQQHPKQDGSYGKIEFKNIYIKELKQR